VDAVVRQVFPGGLEPVSLDDFEGPPADGVVIKSTSAALEPTGLTRGSVVVALDGHAVHSWSQYAVVRALRDTDDMSIIAWDRGRYRQIDVAMPGRKFGVDMRSYER
jgi:hypothetical protein